ncbi:MAG: helix-turn-helix domain-containing protein [Novosphingobium sp.]
MDAKLSEDVTPRLRLLHAAEDLFSRRGIDGVSLREIAVSAGNRNNYAVRYHFESRAGLIQSIFDYRVFQMETLRAAMLDEAGVANRLSDPRALLEVMCLPQLSFVNDQGRHTYAGFLLHYLIYHRPSGMAHVIDRDDEAPGNLRKLLDLLHGLLGHIPEYVRRYRVVSCNIMFASALARWDATPPEHRKGMTLGAILEDTLAAMTAAFCAPYRPRAGEAAYFTGEF